MTIFPKVSKTAVFCKIAKGKCSKMANFFSKLRKDKKILNTGRIVALLIWIESLTIVDFCYARNRMKKDLLGEK